MPKGPPTYLCCLYTNLQYYLAPQNLNLNPQSLDPKPESLNLSPILLNLPVVPIVVPLLVLTSFKIRILQSHPKKELQRRL